jgi:hypothetical protein
LVFPAASVVTAWSQAAAREPRTGRKYLFADEAGNFDFSTRPGASRYFIIGTVTMTETALGNDLVELRRDLAWQGVGLESCFHATEDKQIVRDQVFALLASADLRADFTIVEKRKTQPHRQSQEALYKLAWFMHMKWIEPGRSAAPRKFSS